LNEERRSSRARSSWSQGSGSWMWTARDPHQEHADLKRS
jgi:hypothetical protein